MTPMRAASERCNCGCSDCGGRCCKFECLTRPNFYAGQLLTDQNLKDMVDWVQSKSALDRFRDGWGVACGLDVSIGHKPKEYARVYVASGYAIDCCGRDIVVCDPIWHDFPCDAADDPCCCPKKKPDPVEGGPDGELGCIPFKELRAFDLCLKHDERLTGGQRAMSRGDCKPMSECQYTRVRESGKLYAKEVTTPCQDGDAKVDEKYRRQLKDYIEQLQKNASSPKALLAFIENKLTTFRFVEDCLYKLIRSKDDPPKRWSVGPLFYIVQDFRNRFFECLCDCCSDNACVGDGVALARVWVWDHREKDCRICKVVYIDAYPPYRRLLARDCYPADPGCINLSQHIWRRTLDVQLELSRKGFRNVRTAVFHPSDAMDLADNPDKDVVCAPNGSDLVIHSIKDHCGQERVVAFEKGSSA